MSYGNSDGSDGSSAGGYGSDSSSSSSAGGYGSDSSSSSSAGGYGGDSSSSSSAGGYGSDSSSSSSNDNSNSSFSSSADSTNDSNNDNSDSGSSIDSPNVNSNSSIAAENASGIDSSSSLMGAQLDGSAGNSLNPSEGIVGGTPCSDIGSNYISSTYSGISLDGTAGATLASSEPATAYSFTGYISDSYDSTVASSYQNTMDMSGFQNTEVTEPSLLGSAWNSLAQWADQNVVQPIQEALITPLQNVIADTTSNYAAQQDDSAGNMLNPNQVANVTDLDNNNELAQFSMKPAESLDNLIGTISASTEVTLEGLKAYVSNSLSEMSRPNNIQARVWNNTIQTELAEFSSEVGSLAKGAKAVGYAGIGIGVGVDMYDNIRQDATTEKIVSDAAVDTAFGLGGVGAAVGTGALAGSVIPGAGTLVGAAGGLVGSIGYLGITESWQPGGKSIKDRAKESTYNAIK